MDIKIQPKHLHGTVEAIDSKSHAHRLLIAAALCKESCTIKIKNTNKDIEATRACLENLKSDRPVLPCNESGSTLRFMLPLVMTLKDKACFYGKGRLPERPLSPLKEEMELHGCNFSASPDSQNLTGSQDLPDEQQGNADDPGRLIYQVSGKLQSGTFTLAGNVSSQYITGLLFALPLLSGDSTIELTTPLESRGYVDLTLSVIRAFGIQVSESENAFHIKGNQTYTPPSDEIDAEGDWSNGAFWICADVISRLSGEKGVTCTGLSSTSLQGDKAVLEIAKDMENNYNSKTELIFDVSQIPDLVPVLAVLAACRRFGITRFTNAGRLRIKESDRLSTAAETLTRLGGKVDELPDSLIVYGTGGFKGGTVSGHNDHRIVMAAAIAASASSGPVTILGAEACEKSYPAFFDDYRTLGGQIYDI